MSKILIVGNVLKDVYLKLDERQNSFETDGEGISWLDLGFNGAAHGFFHRTSVYGGAAVSLAVLGRLGLDAKIMGSSTGFQNGEIAWQDEPADYRYILCHEGEISYFVPSSRKATDWKMPSGTPEWILVDRSTVVSPRLVDEIKNFLKFSPTTKLAVHAEKRVTPAGKHLSEMADILFLESEPPVHTQEKIVDKIDLGKPSKQLTCYISPRKIVFGDAEESWSLSRTDMLTHLTVYSTIVATVLGVIAAGGSSEDAVLWARLNAEQATLETTLSARKLQELANIERDKRSNLRIIAQSLVSLKKGLLAADASDHTLTERLVHFGIPATETTRKTYRELLLTTPELSDYVSAVILTEDAARQKVARNQDYVEYLTGRGIITGIKADLGQAPLSPNAPGPSISAQPLLSPTPYRSPSALNIDPASSSASPETNTLGADGLTSRLRRYYNMGCRFAKWHARFELSDNRPSFIAVERATELLAGFAKECQLAGLVPLLETDLLYQGDYVIEQSAAATNRILETLFDKLERRHVDLTSILLKTNMVTSGQSAVAPATPREVGMATSAIILHAVPASIAGVAFLSGGQDANLATKNLVAICENGPFPWPVTFAFSRALEDPVMQTWKGKPENVKSAQAALRRHLQDNVAALGK